MEGEWRGNGLVMERMEEKWRGNGSKEWKGNEGGMEGDGGGWMGNEGGMEGGIFLHYMECDRVNFAEEKSGGTTSMLSAILLWD